MLTVFHNYYLGGVGLKTDFIGVQFNLLMEQLIQGILQP